MRKRETSWTVYRLASRAVYVGRVQAPDEKAAIKAAIRDYAIKNPAEQRRLMVRRSG